MLKIKLLNENCTPYKKHYNDAGWDLRADRDITLEYNNTIVVHTGISVQIPPGYVGLVFPRSGLGSRGVSLTNTVGVIDSDYRGEILLSLKNNNEEPITIRETERVAQLIVLPILLDMQIVDELSETARGDDGFGSSGKI